MTNDDRIQSEINNIKEELEVIDLLNAKLETNLSLDKIEIRAAALS